MRWRPWQPGCGTAQLTRSKEAVLACDTTSWADTGTASVTNSSTPSGRLTSRYHRKIADPVVRFCRGAVLLKNPRLYAGFTFRAPHSNLPRVARLPTGGVVRPRTAGAGGSRASMGYYSTPAASPASASSRVRSGDAAAPSSSAEKTDGAGKSHAAPASPSPSPSPSPASNKASKRWQQVRVAAAASASRPAWDTTPLKVHTPRTPRGSDGGWRSPADTPRSTPGGESAASGLFRLGVSMVLDQEKQDKLAGLIKAVQCVIPPSL